MTNPAPGGLRAEALSTRLGLRPSFAFHSDYDTQDDAGSTSGAVPDDGLKAWQQVLEYG